MAAAATTHATEELDGSSVSTVAVRDNGICITPCALNGCTYSSSNNNNNKKKGINETSKSGLMKGDDRQVETAGECVCFLPPASTLNTSD